MDLVKSILREGLLRESLSGTAFHFTPLTNALKILKSNAINAAYNTTSKSGDKFFMISTTSSKNPNLGYPSTLVDEGEELACFVIDGDKVNQEYKSARVDYYEELKRGFGRDIRNLQGIQSHKRKRYLSKLDEMEDVIVLDEPKLRPLDKYVKEIHAQYDSNEPKRASAMKRKADELDIPIFFYDEYKYFANQVKDKAIDVEADDTDSDKLEPAYKRKQKKEDPEFMHGHAFMVWILSNYVGTDDIKDHFGEDEASYIDQLIDMAEKEFQNMNEFKEKYDENTNIVRIVSRKIFSAMGDTEENIKEKIAQIFIRLYRKKDGESIMSFVESTMSEYA